MEQTLTPLVSVIVSTRNRAGYLDEGLLSLATQHCDVPFEVVVVDNASTDRTPDVIDAWCQRDRRYRHVREERLGLSYGKNAGAAAARGQLLLFADDDVIAAPDWVRRYCNFFGGRDGELVVAGGAIVPVPADLGPWPRWFTQPCLADLGLLDHRQEGPIEFPKYVWGGNFAVSAEVFQRMGGWDETLGRRGDQRGTFEDTDYQDRVRAAGGSVWFVATATMRHRVPRHQITPRSVLNTAFTRGRNGYWQDKIASQGRSVRSVRSPTTAMLADLGKLGLAFAGWLCWSAVFRLTGLPRAFERAHGAAYGCGWLMDRLCDRPQRLVRPMRRSAYKARGLVLRVAAARSSGPSRTA
jgi:glycosyltransferase involved in cell wall biosynthesis